MTPSLHECVDFVRCRWEVIEFGDVDECFLRSLKISGVAKFNE